MQERLKGPEAVGIVAALLPFICHFSSTSSVNGRVTSYFDIVGVIGGIVAIAVALMLAGRNWPLLEKGIGYVALCVGILAVGVYQLLHGAGILMVG